jgi:hypothetical protein
VSLIDYDNFLRWATEKFGEENIKITGEEIRTHSVFTEDQKYHLWMNPTGGKSKHGEYGSYRCWYTNRTGSLVALVAQLDQISYTQAEELLCHTTSLADLEKKVDEFYGYIENEPLTLPTPATRMGLPLPPGSKLISELPYRNKFRLRAEEYLESRKIPIDGLFVCTDEKQKEDPENWKFVNRIVIPYYDREGKIVWWNARTMSKSEKALRYRKPVTEEYRQEDVLFCPKWPRKGYKIYLTEGEFDALSLVVCGFNAAGFGGKTLSEPQLEVLRDYIPVLALDTDESGKDWGGIALIEIGERLIASGFPEVYFVRPPKGYKDWNNLLIAKGPDILCKYINKYETRFDAWTADLLRLK